MKRSGRWTVVAAVNGFLAVALGAFAAHGLKPRLSAELLDVFEVGARYHMYHALAMLAAAGLAGAAASRGALWSCRMFLAGIVLFSGSLYAMALSGVRALGAITPFGGAAFLAGWVLLALAATAHGGDGELADVLERIREKHQAPALAAARVEGSKLAEIAAVGVREYGKPDRVTTEDRFHIGSCTKAMTATVLAGLVEDGKLRWTSTPAEVFPELAERMHADYRDVTLELLLAHRAGVPADLAAEGLWDRLWAHKGTPLEQRRTLLEGVLLRAPAHKPGSAFLYSNAGYAIAGAMAEKAAGRPWEDLVSERLFKPLGMASAGFGAPGTADKLDQPRGHVLKDGQLSPVSPGRGADNPAAIAPAGTVHCTLGDWAKFVAEHVRGERGESKLLKAETFRTLHRPREGQDYAFGWSFADRPWGGGRVLTHAGSNTMWFAVVWVAPERDFAVLAATNVGDGRAFAAVDEAVAAMIARRAEAP